MRVSFRYQKQTVKGKRGTLYTVYWDDPITGKKDALLCVIEGKSGKWYIPMPKDTLGPFVTREQAADAYLVFILDPVSEDIETEVYAKWQTNHHRDIRVLNHDTAEKVYDLLVKHGGALVSNESSFIFHHTKDKYVSTEWRFSGWFGFGGKFRNGSSRFAVDCYQENQTPLRRWLISQLNIKLQELYEETFHDEG